MKNFLLFFCIRLQNLFRIIQYNNFNVQDIVLYMGPIEWFVEE